MGKGTHAFFKKYGIKLDKAEKVINNLSTLSLVHIFSVLLESNNEIEAMSIHLIERVYGVETFLKDFSKCYQLPFHEISVAYSTYRNSFKMEDIYFTGSEALVILLNHLGIDTAVGYPGTSELSLCDAFDRYPFTTVLNGRGDKESTFSAAGMNLYHTGKCISILHGARGLTNSGGAVADIRRNEIDLFVVVGLPSRSSSVFLPPHGEKNLLGGMSTFAKDGEEFKPEQLNPQMAEQYLKKIQKGLKNTVLSPKGPILFGIPQDILEKKWVPYLLLQEHLLESIVLEQEVSDFCNELDLAYQLITKSSYPLVIFDDYALRGKLKEKLKCFCNTYHLPAFQLHYRRGPMLFEQFSINSGNYIKGFYDPGSKSHKSYMEKADLLITIEDRNMYERVVGILPKCKKIAFTSNPPMTLKNGYLTNEDIVLKGSVETSIDALLEKTVVENQYQVDYEQNDKWHKRVWDGKYDYIWDMLTKEIGNFLERQKTPVLIDDSQMFGGFLSKWYHNLPSRVRVFGDHGAFIGSGISYSTGVAYANQENFVVVTLGDQGFTNGFQGLVCASDTRLRILYIICNNGKSISLMKQGMYDNGLSVNDMEKISLETYLSNSENLDYCKIAEAVGISSFRVVLTNIEEAKVKSVQKQLQEIWETIIKNNRAAVLELVMPSQMDVWDGVWCLTGLEQPSKERVIYGVQSC